MDLDRVEAVFATASAMMVPVVLMARKRWRCNSGPINRSRIFLSKGSNNMVDIAQMAISMPTAG